MDANSSDPFQKWFLATAVDVECQVREDGFAYANTYAAQATGEELMQRSRGRIAMSARQLTLAAGVALLSACDTGTRLKHGAEALADAEGNHGLDARAFASCDVVMFRSPLVVKGMTIYVFSACPQGKSEQWVAALADQLGMEKTPDINTSARQMLEALQRAEPSVALPFSAANAYGIKFCPAGTSGDPKGRFVYQAEEKAVLVTYGGGTKTLPNDFTSHPLLEDCPSAPVAAR